MTNKKNAPKIATLTAARLTALAPVRRAAFQSGAARSAVVAATLAACGRSPNALLYAGAKLELQVGFMGAALARKGDNREPEAIMTQCRSLLTEYQGFGGTAKLRAGMKGRRTKAQEDAYGSARVLVSGVMGDAGVKVKGAESRGGDTSKTRAPGGKVAAGKAAKKIAANDAKPVIARYKDKAALLAGFLVDSSLLLTKVNRNAKIAPNDVKAAVMDFHAAMKRIAAAG